jgi:hypothetical protein
VLFDAETTQYVAIAGAGLGLIGLGVGFGSSLRLRRLRRSYAGVSRAAESGDLLGDIAKLAEECGDLRVEVGFLRGEVARTQAGLADAIRHVAVVRYDAFDDMGGRLSFSAAMLDDSGDGLVLTSIHSRSETRSYAKGVKAAVSTLPLSAEEQQAIGFATRSTTQRGGRHASVPDAGEV